MCIRDSRRTKRNSDCYSQFANYYFANYARLDPSLKNFFEECCFFICEIKTRLGYRKFFNFYIGLRLTPGESKDEQLAIQWDKYSMMADEQFQKYEVHYETTAGETYTQDVTDNVETPSYIITGLDAATGYNIKVRVLSRDFGYSEDSKALNAYTDEHTASELSAVEVLETTLVSYHFSIYKKDT